MAREVVPEIYFDTFADDWQADINNMMTTKQDYLSSEIALRLLRQEIKTKLEAEIYKTISVGIPTYEAVNSLRIKSIYNYCFERHFWPVYGLGCGHCVNHLVNYGPFPLPEIVEMSSFVAHEYQIILNELNKVRNRISTETREFIYTGTWRSITLWESNVQDDMPATKIFRQTMELLLTMPLLKKVFDLSKSNPTFRGFTIRVSQLKGMTTILPHYGLTNSRLRLQIPLVIPDGDLYIYSHNEYRRWTLGQPIILDDSYIHGVQNNTHEDRIVLLVDLPHPDASILDITSY